MDVLVNNEDRGIEKLNLNEFNQSVGTGVASFIQWVLVPFPGGKWLRHGIDNPPASSAEVKNG